MTDETAERALPPIAISAFAGPFDLLLHLIRVNEVSITDIPIAEITEQYTAYLDAMRELDLDVASEYPVSGPGRRPRRRRRPTGRHWRCRSST